MTVSMQTKLPDLVIASGDTESNILESAMIDDAVALCLYAPATLIEAITIEVSPEPHATSASMWTVLNDGTADIAGPTAGKARVYYELANCGSIRLKAGAAVAADRTFSALKSFTS